MSNAMDIARKSGSGMFMVVATVKIMANHLKLALQYYSSVRFDVNLLNCI